MIFANTQNQEVSSRPDIYILAQTYIYIYN